MFYDRIIIEVISLKILVTGGLGYIGSHTIVELVKKGHDVVIVDDLSNAQLETLDKLESITNKRLPFYEMNVTDEKRMEALFIQESFDALIHFAGFKAVGESVYKPLEYYYNNVVSTMILAKLCIKHHVAKFIFSSSATVYGDGVAPFSETSPLLRTTNPYGETKAMSERILMDTAFANKGFNPVLLRYFNPIGAHESGLLGELPNGVPNNLMPYVTQVAKGIREKLSVYGNDYDTIDGTGVRDYIHVVDLAKGHVAAVEADLNGANVFNLGTGKGTSVLEIIKAFESENNIKLNYQIVERRAGDIATSYADVKKAKEVLGWEAKLGIKEMVKDAWYFEKNIK